MSTSSTDRFATRLLPLLLVAGLAGCAAKQGSQSTEPVADTVSVVKPVREQAPAPEVAASTAEHVTPVAHDPAVEPLAAKAAGEFFAGIQLMNAGDLDRALVVFQELSARYPRLSGPQVNVGVIHLRQQHMDDALAALDGALKTNPSNPYAWSLRGVALREQGKFREAKASYEKALALDPLYAKAHFNLAVLADLYLQDLALALQHYQRYQALQKTPDQAVGNWIKDLQNRLGLNAPAPAPVVSEPPAAGDAQSAPADADAPADTQTTEGDAA